MAKILARLKPNAWVVLCTASAVSFSLFLRETALRGFTPYGFLAVVVVAAKLWGRLAGVLGTAAGALAFSLFLYNPVGSWIVNDDLARANLGWMVLVGMMLAHFIGRFNVLQKTG
ncbi:MAG TPA: DUF4118 domain-containing protein [Candidatus Angelobacter sp.]